MESVAKRTLALVLLLTQVAAMVASPAFTLCISPKGHVCIDAPWTACTCCEDEGNLDQEDQCRGEVVGDDKVCTSEKRCSCRCGNDDPPPTATPEAPSDPNSEVSHRQPCRCKHFPLIDAQDGRHLAVERTTTGDQLALDQLLLAPAISPFGGFSPSRQAISLLPLPPPSGHLLAISCTVLRC